MKKRLTRKLFLSLAAMGVTAATLTTSTFAWYTYNAEATVTQITAGTESSGNNSIFIAPALTYDTTDTTKADSWDDYVATATIHPTGFNFSTDSLKPVYSNFGNLVGGTSAVAGRAYNKIQSSAKTIVQASGKAKENTTYYSDAAGTQKVTEITAGTTDVSTYYVRQDTVSYSDETTKDFIEFVFRVRTSSKVTEDEGKNLYFSKFDLTVDQSKATQVALAKNGVTGVNDNTFTASLAKALKLDVTSANVGFTAGVIDAAGTTSRLKGDATSETNAPKTYGFEALADATKEAGISTANAIGYYNTVMGTGLVEPDTHTERATKLREKDTDGKLKAIQANEQAVVVANLPKTDGTNPFTVVEVRFVLYLDGWDNYCYDIMQNQTFTLDFALTTEINSAVLLEAKPE